MTARQYKGEFGGAMRRFSLVSRFVLSTTSLVKALATSSSPDYIFILLFVEIGSKNSRTFVDDISERIRAFEFLKVLEYRKLAKFSSISNLCKFSNLSKFGTVDKIRKCRRMSFYVEKGGENERWWCCARDWLWLNWMVEILKTKGFIFLKKVS